MKHIIASVAIALAALPSVRAWCCHADTKEQTAKYSQICYDADPDYPVGYCCLKGKNMHSCTANTVYTIYKDPKGSFLQLPSGCQNPEGAITCQYLH
ncbi:unnamed protein product [Cercospora beticola]|nr:unnamed protein product [Cercospora beticola]